MEKRPLVQINDQRSLTVLAHLLVEPKRSRHFKRRLAFKFGDLLSLSSFSLFFTLEYIYSSIMVKVTVCGAAGGIGQPLSLLLKQSDLITHLSLYDIVNTPGVAADLSHINTKSKVTGHVGAAQLEEAIKDSAIGKCVAFSHGCQGKLVS